MYSTFPGVQGYKIWKSNDFWESNNFDYRHPNHSQSFDEKLEKPKHKYQVNDSILDVNSGRVGRIRELLTWPNYLVLSSMGSWICNESHIEPLADDIDESSLSINDINDYWEEEQEPSLSTLYNPLSTGITDITDTGDITISKNKVDLAKDGGICVIGTVSKHGNDIEELTHISDINMQKISDIEVKTYDIEHKVIDLEKKQKKISKLSKLALLSRFL